MFGALKRGRFRSLASLILVVNVVNVGELQRKRTLAASRGFLAAARLSCFVKVIAAIELTKLERQTDGWTGVRHIRQPYTEIKHHNPRVFGEA